MKQIYNYILQNFINYLYSHTDTLSQSNTNAPIFINRGHIPKYNPMNTILNPPYRQYYFSIYHYCLYLHPFYLFPYYPRMHSVLP